MPDDPVATAATCVHVYPEGGVCGIAAAYHGEQLGIRTHGFQPATAAATVSVPVTWNDADRDAGIDWWIANATYWHDRAMENYRQRDAAADYQRRIDRTVAYLLHLLDGPLDAGTAMVAKAAIEGLTTPTKGGNP